MLKEERIAVLTVIEETEMIALGNDFQVSLNSVWYSIELPKKLATKEETSVRHSMETRRSDTNPSQ